MVADYIVWWWYWTDGPASGSLENMPCGLGIGGEIVSSSWGKYEVSDILHPEAMESIFNFESNYLVEEYDLDPNDKNVFIILRWKADEVLDTAMARHLKIGDLNIF